MTDQRTMENWGREHGQVAQAAIDFNLVEHV